VLHLMGTLHQWNLFLRRTAVMQLKAAAMFAVVLLQDIHVSKLSRGSRVELLELLQYLYKYLLSECCNTCHQLLLRLATQHLRTCKVATTARAAQCPLGGSIWQALFLRGSALQHYRAPVGDALLSNNKNISNDCEAACLPASCAAEFKAMESYNARERRAITVRGGTDAVPLPSWMSGSQAAGRGSGRE
jgi:hypothetical protein